MSKQSLVIDVGTDVSGVKTGLSSTQRMVEAVKRDMEKQTAAAERALNIEKQEQQILTYKVNGQKVLQRHAETILRTEQLAAELRRKGIATDEQALTLAKQRVRIENEVALARRMQDAGSGGGRVGNLGNAASVRQMGRGGMGRGGAGGRAGGGSRGNFGYEAAIGYNFFQDLAQGGLPAVANNVPQLLQSSLLKAIVAPVGALAAVGAALWTYEDAVKGGTGMLHSAAKGIRDFWITNFGNGDTRTAGEKQQASFKESLALQKQQSEARKATKDAVLIGTATAGTQENMRAIEARDAEKFAAEIRRKQTLKDEERRLAELKIGNIVDEATRNQKLFEFRRDEMRRELADQEEMNRLMLERAARESDARAAELRAAVARKKELDARPGEKASDAGKQEYADLSSRVEGLQKRADEAKARLDEQRAGRTELERARALQPVREQQLREQMPQQGFGSAIRQGVQEGPLAGIFGTLQRGVSALQTGDAQVKNKRDITQAREIEDMKAQQQQTQQQGGRVSRRDEKKLRDLEKDYSVRKDTNSLIQQGFTPDEAAKMASSSYAAQNPEPSRGRIKGAKSERNAFRGLNDKAPSRLDNQTFDGLDKQSFGGLDALKNMQTASREKPKGKDEAASAKPDTPPPVQGGVGMLLPILQSIKAAVDRGVAAQRMKPSTTL